MIRIITALLLILIASPALAQTAEPPIGAVLALEGEGNLIMRASEGGKTYPAKLNDQIYRDDVMQTGPAAEARMLLVLIDESRFTLGANSKFKIDDYAYDDVDDAANMARYNLSQGAFLYTSGLMTKKSNPDVKITTPYCAIGVRGTTLWGGQLGDQFGVYVDEGEASLESKRGHIFIKSGQGTSITGPTAIPQKPHILDEEIVAAARATVTLKDTDKIRERMAEAKKNYPAMVGLHKDYIHNARSDQADKKGYVRGISRGVLKVEQDRANAKLKVIEDAAPKDVPTMGMGTPEPEVKKDAVPEAIPAEKPAEPAPTPKDNAL